MNDYEDLSRFEIVTILSGFARPYFFFDVNDKRDAVNDLKVYEYEMKLAIALIDERNAFFKNKPKSRFLTDKHCLRNYLKKTSKINSRKIGDPLKYNRYLIWEEGLEELKKLKEIDLQMRAKLDITKNKPKNKNRLDPINRFTSMYAFLDKTLQQYDPPDRPEDHRFSKDCSRTSVEWLPNAMPSTFKEIIDSLRENAPQIPGNSDDDDKDKKNKLSSVNEFFKGETALGKLWAFVTDMECHFTNAGNIEGCEFLDSCFGFKTAFGLSHTYVTTSCLGRRHCEGVSQRRLVHR